MAGDGSAAPLVQLPMSQVPGNSRLSMRVIPLFNCSSFVCWSVCLRVALVVFVKTFKEWSFCRGRRGSADTLYVGNFVKSQRSYHLWEQTFVLPGLLWLKSTQSTLTQSHGANPMVLTVRYGKKAKTPGSPKLSLLDHAAKSLSTGRSQVRGHFV